MGSFLPLPHSLRPISSSRLPVSDTLKPAPTVSPTITQMESSGLDVFPGTEEHPTCSAQGFLGLGSGPFILRIVTRKAFILPISDFRV